MIRWHRTTIAAANPPATEPLPPAAQRQAPHTLRCRHLNRLPKMASAIRRTAAERAPPPTGGFGQSPLCANGGVGGFPPERTNGTAVSGGRRGGTATRRRIRTTSIAARRTAAPQPQAEW